MSNYTFINTEYFYFLIFPIGILLFYIIKKQNRDVYISFSNTAHLEKQKSPKVYFRNLPFFFKILSSILLIVALARPQSSINWEESTIEGIDIMLTIDISASMLAEDLKPNRLDASKNVAIDFISKRNNDRIGIVVFSGESFTQCPLTIDHQVLVNLFKDIKTVEWLAGGTAMGMGLLTAINRLKDSEAKSKVIILITDGVNNTGDFTPFAAAEMAKKFGICVYTIGVGKKGNAKIPVGVDIFGRKIYQTVEGLDEKTLQDIAITTKGKYFRATSNRSLSKVYEQIDKLEKSKIQVSEFHKRSEEFVPFASSALILLLVAFISQITIFRKIT